MNILVVGPHPDDQELGMGGTIARLADQGHDVLLLDMTNGEPTPHGDPGTYAAGPTCSGDEFGPISGDQTIWASVAFIYRLPVGFSVGGDASYGSEIAFWPSAGYDHNISHDFISLIFIINNKGNRLTSAEAEACFTHGGTGIFHCVNQGR